MINVENKFVIILGAARSGLAAAKLLNNKGAKVFVSDIAQAENKMKEIKELNDENIKFEFGGHTDKILDAEFAVLSPGIPKSSAVVKEFISRSIPVFSELEVAYWFCKSPIIAITGSNGKTTTTSLLGEMLKAENPDSIIAGNIGSPLSDYVGSSKVSDWAAVEVSSFQLETVDTFHAKIVIILNLAPNHLDWYDSFESYVEAKLLILKNLTSEDYLIYNHDDKLLSQKISECPANKIRFSIHDDTSHAYLEDNNVMVTGEFLIDANNIKLKGSHNHQNSMAAALAAGIAGVKNIAIIQVLETFPGVEHRLEFVSDINGVHFINDSKATTVESLGVALTSFRTPIILIAGGKDKGSDYTKLNQLIAENVKAAVLIGAAQNKMNKAWHDVITLHMASDLASAIEMAFQLAESGDNILLSPACSSFDMFNDYEDRGRKFKKTVQQLKDKYEN